MAVDWCRDTIGDIIMELNASERLSYDQCFMGVTEERTQQIFIGLTRAKEALDLHLEELEEELK